MIRVVTVDIILRLKVSLLLVFRLVNRKKIKEIAKLLAILCL